TINAEIESPCKPAIRINHETRLNDLPSSSNCTFRHGHSYLPALGTSYRGRERSRHVLCGVSRSLYCVCVYGFHPAFRGAIPGVQVVGYAGRNEIFSERSVQALRTIKYCALVLIGFVAVSVLFMIGGDRDDRPAGTFMRILITFPSIIVAISAAMFERILQNAVDIKSENDLTV